MRGIYSILLLLVFTVPIVIAQQPMPPSPPSSEKEYQAAYKKRIQEEYLYDVYIPMDLTDAFIQLNKLIEPSAKSEFKKMPEAAASRGLHYSFGRWMIHNWGFYGGSRLSHFIRELGIAHPDDMAQFIIISYHRSLNKNPLNVKEQVQYYQEKRKQLIEDKRKENGKIISTTKRKRKPAEE